MARKIVRKRKRDEEGVEEAVVEAAPKRHKSALSVHEAVDAVSRVMDARTSRFQMQVVGQKGATGLYVVVAYTDESKREACSHLVNPWIAIVGGLTANKSVPNFLAKEHWKFHTRGKPNLSIEQSLRSLQKIRDGDKKAERENKSLAALWRKHGEQHPLPEGTQVIVVMEHVHANRFDVVVYKDAFHGNVACSTPRVVVHGDALEHGNTASEREMLRVAFEGFRDGEKEALDYGKHTRSALVELEMLHKRAKEEALWLPQMPTMARQRCFLGELDWDECADGKEIVLEGLVTHADRERLETRGYIVINVRRLLQERYYLDWRMTVELALYELEQAFNYALFERNGYTDRDKHWLSFDDDEEREENELWHVLRGQKESEALLGERHFMNIKRDGAHCKTAQGGNSMCTKSCGMGFATNFTRGKYQLQLGCHEVVMSLFQALYETPYVYNTHERFRVKYGTGTVNSDEFPRHGLMPLHSDIMYNI